MGRSRNKVAARDRQIGQRLHARRNHLVMAESVLALRVGTTSRKILRIEQGKESASRSFLERAAEALMVDLQFFYDGVLPSERAKPALRRGLRSAEDAPPMVPTEPPIDAVEDEVPANPSNEYIVGLLDTLRVTKPEFFHEMVKMIAVVATGKLPEV